MCIRDRSIAELKEASEGDFLGLPPCPTTIQSVKAEVSMSGESDSGGGIGLPGRLAVVQPEGLSGRPGGSLLPHSAIGALSAGLMLTTSALCPAGVWGPNCDIVTVVAESASLFVSSPKFSAGVGFMH